ncbi:MAG: LysR substrate-binding domain-containing protein [Promethearchaeota archaeon]
MSPVKQPKPKTDFSISLPILLSKVRLGQLYAFFILVQNKSFSETAKILKKTQSTISLQIQDLEKILGDISLIERSSKSFLITNAGKILYNSLQNIFPLWNDAIDEITATGIAKKNSISIISSTIPGEYLLPGKMMEFRKKYPNCNISIEISNTRGALDRLLENHVDFAAVGSILEFNQDLFDITEIGVDTFVILARDGHPIFNSKNLLKDIYSFPWIFREKGSASRSCFLKKFPNSDRIQIALEFANNNSILNALKFCDALSALSSHLLPCSHFNLHEQGLKQLIDPKIPVINRKLYLVSRKNTKLTKLQRLFQSFISTEK